MENASSYVKKEMKKGAWTEEEDNKLRTYIQRYGHWNWGLIPKFAGVCRSGKSCRLRWMNYLRPNMKHGNFTQEEDNIIIDLHNKIGNKWSTIAAKLQGRSDNEVKNRWNTHLKKRVQDDQTVSGSEIIESLQDGEHPAVKGIDLEHQQEPEMFTPPTFVDEMVGDLWSGQFLQDDDGSIIPSGENLFSPLNFVNDYIYQSSCQEMIMSDEFLWSALDTYVEDNMWNS